MIGEYFADISSELNRRSESIRSWFATHRPSSGENRESLVSNFLSDYLPDSFFISSGLVVSAGGEFSNQADAVIIDNKSNKPLFRGSPVPIWFVESLYAFLEVKTSLRPEELRDALIKCRKFKNLPRHFGDSFGQQKITDSLFILWAFEAPSLQTAKANILAALKGTEFDKVPDFIIVPGKFLFVSGQYRRLTEIGQPDSPYWREKVQEAGSEEAAMNSPYIMYNFGDNALLVFLYWITSWLVSAGPRRADIIKYLPDDYSWGTVV